LPTANEDIVIYSRMYILPLPWIMLYIFLTKYDLCDGYVYQLKHVGITLIIAL